jgi:hypothetical protein
MTRLRSVYFKKFQFASGMLPLSFLKSFGGAVDQQQVKLRWEFQAAATVKSERLEMSTDGRNFVAVMNAAVSSEDISLPKQWQGRLESSVAYFRLRIEHADREVEYSRILMFRNEAGSGSGMRIYPNLVQDQATLQLQSASDELASYALYDPSGRLVRQQKFRLSKGQNNISLDDMASLQRGQYFVVVQCAGVRHTSKIMRQ